MRHFGPRIKTCFDCRHFVEKCTVDPLYIRYCNGMEVLEKLQTKAISESVSYV